mgnify:CR=1 FL=1
MTGVQTCALPISPHQPVHLGAMSEAVRQQVKLQGKMLKVGDVLLTNHPIAGGSHLPDITIVTPVWKDGKAIFYIASRDRKSVV